MKILKNLFCKIGIHEWREINHHHKRKLKCEKCGKIVPKWYATDYGR